MRRITISISKETIRALQKVAAPSNAQLEMLVEIVIDEFLAKSRSKMPKRAQKCPLIFLQ